MFNKRSSGTSTRRSKLICEIIWNQLVVYNVTVQCYRGLLDAEPVYAEVERRKASHTQSEPTTAVLGHRRHLSACAATMTSPSQQLSVDLQAAVDSLALLPVHIRPRSECVDSEQSHDYAEIYTPSREKPPWDCPKPPTPPLHRFPSWESRIYQVANEGLATSQAAIETSHHQGSGSQGYKEISVPVFATVKGRASQIRSMPFTGDSSDDSSDGEAEHTNNAMNHSGTRATNSSSDNTDTSLSSPSKSHKTTSSLSPAKRSSSDSPSKNTSFESGMSDDYAIPPDALSCESLEWSLVMRTTDSPRHQRTSESLEKSGHLAKLGGKLKTWRRRWFQLSNAKLRYWKSQNDMGRKPQGEISIDDQCRITRADGAVTFEITTGKKTYYLTADSIAATEDWVRVLQNVQRRNATKLLLSKEQNKPTLQGWLTKVRNGHAKKCWCVLIGKMFLYFKSPSDSEFSYRKPLLIPKQRSKSSGLVDNVIPESRRPFS
ncbi:Pleckstrin y domain-containing H member 2 [Homalodisca vitripennis]|nr:Pleckstrin y domain-containing H member 2 [Homalodisca vitripennis]